MANPGTPHAKLPWRLDPRFVIGMPLRMVDQWREREKRDQKMENTSMPSNLTFIGPDGSQQYVPRSSVILQKARPPMPKAAPPILPKARPLASESSSHAVRTLAF